MMTIVRGENDLNKKILLCVGSKIMKFILLAVLFCGTMVLARAQKQAKCDHRFFQHYLVRECQPVFGPNDSECPVRYSCPPFPPKETSGCKFQGSIIPIGNDFPTGIPCKVCNCQPGGDGAHPQIVCKNAGCSSVLGPLEDDCYQIFEKDKCCSNLKVCGASAQSRPTCEYKGESYFTGQHIHSVEDPCLVCICQEGWTGTPETDPNCIRFSCVMEKDLDKMEAGCVPVYYESACCPLGYDCGKNVQNTTTPMATDEEIASGDACVFKGSHYRVGQLLDLGLPINCVTCECVTPPEFTCVIEGCPEPGYDA